MRRLASLLCALALIAFAAAPALAGTPVSNLGILKGVTYSPTPSDYKQGMWKYEDSDFCTSQFKALWGVSNGVGREDLKHISQDLHANFIRLYDWNQANDHGEFLDTAASYGIKVAVPISDWYLEQYETKQSSYDTVKGWVYNIVKEAYDHRAGVAMFSVGNEYDLDHKINANTVAAIMEMIVAAEVQLGVASSDLLAVCSPVSFAQTSSRGPAIDALAGLKTAIEASHTLSSHSFYQDRYVAAVNCFNPGSDLTTFINTTFPAAFPGTKLIFTELGRSDQEAGGDQAGWVKAQAEAALSGGASLGCAIFHYEDQSWKSGPEGHFGLNTVTAGTTQINYDRGAYPLDVYSHKASFDAIAGVYAKH